MNIYNVFLSGAIKYLSHSCVSLLLCCSNITHPAQHIRITALMTIFHVLVLFIMTFSCRLLCLEGILGIGSLQRFQHMENYVILLGSCWPIELQPETPSCTLLLLVFQEKSENSAAKKNIVLQYVSAVFADQTVIIAEWDSAQDWWCLIATRSHLAHNCNTTCTRVIIDVDRSKLS